jgi:hypothetical protein
MENVENIDLGGEIDGWLYNYVKRFISTK